MTQTQIKIPKDTQKAWVKLSPQQRTFILTYLVNGGSSREAYLAAGYKPKNYQVADICASKLLSSAKVTAVIYSLLKAHRLTPEYADIKLAELLEAKETKFFQFNGRVMDKRNVIAWGPRKEGLDMLNRIHGRYKSDKAGDTPAKREPIIIVISDKEKTVSAKNRDLATPSRLPTVLSESS